MPRLKILIALLSMLLLTQEARAQLSNPDEMLVLKTKIRQEKLDLILPQAMRDNKIDMWIHVLRAGDHLDLGATRGYCVFTDRGEERIERAIFDYGWSRLSEYQIRYPGTYDIVGREYPEESENLSPFHGLRAFVAERDPERIAVNYSKRLRLADGISHTDYLELAKELGDTYAPRIVSADSLIIDFLVRGVPGEIEMFGKLTKIVVENIDREFDKIEVGKTALIDIPGNVILADPDGNERSNDNYRLQGGDLFTIGMSKNIDNFDGGMMKFGYVLREGETELPTEVQDVFEHGLRVRKIFRENVQAGPTVRQTLKLLIVKLEAAGYIYVDSQRYDTSLNPDKTQVAIDMHAMGREIDIPRIGPINSDWAQDLRIPLLHTFTFEYMVYMPVPKWGKGKHLSLGFHDSAVVTKKGIEFVYPPVERVRVID